MCPCNSSHLNKPRFNYQKQILEEEIASFITEHRVFLEDKFEAFSSGAEMPKQAQIVDFSKFLDNEPAVSKAGEDEPIYRPVKVNYLEKEQNNRSLGEAGEGLVIGYEKWRLIDAGKESLADKIEWVSKDQGDGTGFDILSKNNNGTDRYIEVKTTKLSKETPIYLTRVELGFAAKKEKDFFLYRVFDFNTTPQLFIKKGKYENFCKLSPQTYKGYF